VALKIGMEARNSNAQSLYFGFFQSCKRWRGHEEKQ